MDTVICITRHIPCFNLVHIIYILSTRSWGRYKPGIRQVHVWVKYRHVWHLIWQTIIWTFLMQILHMMLSMTWLAYDIMTHLYHIWYHYWHAWNCIWYCPWYHLHMISGLAYIKQIHSLSWCDIINNHRHMISYIWYQM